MQVLGYQLWLLEFAVRHLTKSGKPIQEVPIKKQKTFLCSKHTWCVCVCVYVCVYVCMYVCVYVCMYVCVCLYLPTLSLMRLVTTPLIQAVRESPSRTGVRRGGGGGGAGEGGG